MHTSDSLYKDPRNSIGNFVFDQHVAAVFPDMLARSVPGYGVMLSMIEILAKQYVRNGTICYDLGCSLGAVSLAICQATQGMDIRVTAVDNSPDMIHTFSESLKQKHKTLPIDLVCADIRDILIDNTSFVVLHLSLQFVDITHRLALLKTIYDGLCPGGVLEKKKKCVMDNPIQQHCYEEMHNGFKQYNGYTTLEIEQKRVALENILIPESVQTHTQRCYDAGFQHCFVWFQCINFVSMMALKV